jgi:hypothetical protein
MRVIRRRADLLSAVARATLKNAYERVNFFVMKSAVDVGVGSGGVMAGSNIAYIAIASAAGIGAVVAAWRASRAWRVVLSRDGSTTPAFIVRDYHLSLRGAEDRAADAVEVAVYFTVKRRRAAAPKNQS